jgi:hypothetical protein
MSGVSEAVARRIREVLAGMPPTTDEQRTRAVAILANAKARPALDLDQQKAA